MSDEYGGGGKLEKLGERVVSQDAVCRHGLSRKRGGREVLICEIDGEVR